MYLYFGHHSVHCHAHTWWAFNNFVGQVKLPFLPICGTDIFSELVQESHGLHFTSVTTWAKDPHFVSPRIFLENGLRLAYDLLWGKIIEWDSFLMAIHRNVCLFCANQPSTLPHLIINRGYLEIHLTKIKRLEN